MSIKKVKMLLAVGVMAGFSSCIDGTYDLANKELVTDVAIEGNKLALPLGNLRAIMLDSLLSVEDSEFLEKLDGVYSISISDSVPIELSVDPISFSLPTQSYSSNIDFVKADITEVDIKGITPEPASFNVPTVSLDGLKLPDLSSKVRASLVTEGLGSYLDALDNLPTSATIPPYEFKNEKYTVSDKITFEMDYTLPEQIKTLSTIKLANPSEGENATTGSLVLFNVHHPEALEGVSKTIKFHIEFPEQFRLSLDKTIAEVDKYKLTNGHVLTIEGLVDQDNHTTIQFFIDEMTGLEKYVDESTGTLSLDEVISYNVEYELNGQVNLSKGINRDELAFSVEMNLPLGFRDIAGETNDITVDFEPIIMDFHAHFDNLQYIDRVDSIMFDAKNSVLIFDADMSGGFSPFRLKEGYGLRLSFPDELVINDELSAYPTKNDAQPKIKYSAREHAYYIYDLDALAHSHWELALERIILKKPVVNGVFDFDVVAEVAAVDPNFNKTGSLLLAGVKLESLTNTLKSLQRKEANFSISDSHLAIIDAIVHTEKIISPLDAHVEVSMTQKVPSEMGRVEYLGIVEDVPVVLSVDIEGLEFLDTDVYLDMHIALPSSMKLVSDDPEAVIKGDSLLMKAKFDPDEGTPINIKLHLIEGFDFMTKDPSGKGLTPKDSTDGNSYISYKEEFVILGDMYIDGSEYHSQVLEAMGDVIAHFGVTADMVDVKDFKGLYLGGFDKVEEAIDLDLGEGLAFLKDENNSMTLAEPQIIVEFENTMGVPVDIDLQLSGKDENGTVIESSVISTVLHIDAADYDVATGEDLPRETKIFITSDIDRVSMQGYQNVEIPNLARLFERLPSSIALTALPVVDQNVTHHVNLTQPLKIKGKYSVVVPLKFDSFNMCYNDTIRDMQLDLEGVLDMFSNLSLQVKMDVKNTLPVGLAIGVTALDENDDVITDITVDSLKISAGNGTPILDADEGEKVQFAIKSKSGDLSKLDKLTFGLKAFTDHTVGGVALRGEQGIQLSNIVLEVSGDIVTNLTE